LFSVLTGHWKPFFRFAFSSGLRLGEQIGIKPGDIDWENQTLNICQAITYNENGKIIEGNTKNKYSRRSIKLLPVSLEALLAQKEIYNRFKGDYFFCNTKGNRIDRSSLRREVWIPALKRAGLPIREIKQTRHTFATLAQVYHL